MSKAFKHIYIILPVLILAYIFAVSFFINWYNDYVIYSHNFWFIYYAILKYLGIFLILLALIPFIQAFNTKNKKIFIFSLIVFLTASLFYFYFQYYIGITTHLNCRSNCL